jgi:hypothetical protein
MTLDDASYSSYDEPLEGSEKLDLEPEPSPKPPTYPPYNRKGRLRGDSLFHSFPSYPLLEGYRKSLGSPADPPGRSVLLVRVRGYTWFVRRAGPPRRRLIRVVSRGHRSPVPPAGGLPWGPFLFAREGVFDASPPRFPVSRLVVPFSTKRTESRTWELSSAPHWSPRSGESAC